MHKFAAAGVAFGGCVTLVVGIVSVATPDWVVLPSASTSAGLWELCSNGICLNYSSINLPDYFLAVRAFHILGIIACAVAIAASGMLVASKKAPKSVVLVFFLGTAVCFLISMSVFTAKEELTRGLQYGYSYILGWVAFGLAVFLTATSGVFLRQE